jgi:hypothetical protein
MQHTTTASVPTIKRHKMKGSAQCKVHSGNAAVNHHDSTILVVSVYHMLHYDTMLR